MTDKTKPVWFLDVDGVINADKPYKNKWGNWKHGVVHTRSLFDEPISLDIHWAQEVVDFLNNLMDTVDVVWLTSWSDTANTELVPLIGLNQTLPNAFTLAEFVVPSHPAWKEVWNLKRTTVRTLIGEGGKFEGRPFIWTDDDLDRSARQEFNYLGKRNTLFVRPFETTGLIPADLKRITDFLQDLDRQETHD